MLFKRRILSLIMLLSVTLLVGCSGLRYSGTKGGKTKYQEVKTDVVELTINYYSDTRPVKYIFSKIDNFVYFSEESLSDNKESVVVSEEIIERVNKWVDEYNVKSWDGYDMTRKNVLDGGGFRLDIKLATGETISAHGSNVYPDGYRGANVALREIIEEAKEEINEAAAFVKESESPCFRS